MRLRARIAQSACRMSLPGVGGWLAVRRVAQCVYCNGMADPVLVETII